ncbi:MAG: sigma-54-dependent Fis family transcriptional regulator [Acidobacteria bacterium]|nr:sigma-54-dependent Fis family transcriptional regulator [Acidobacteriota bacterium]
MTDTKGKILIVDDDTYIRDFLSALLTREGFTTALASDGQVALRLVRSYKPDVLIVDVRMPGISGLEVLRDARTLDDDLEIIMMTGYAEVREAVHAMRLGAYDYLPKPLQADELNQTIRKALSRHNRRTLGHGTDPVQEPAALCELMGPSDTVSQIARDIDRVAKSNFNVLITGETGTGKEIVAHAIHSASPRAAGPFVPVDCGAIPDTLLESELFGHEKGAFTGANGRTTGKFQVASGGTLFLDEICNLPLGSQAKFLRAIQDRVVYPIGSTKPVKVDVRLVAATNTDLHASTASGSFRGDLLFRLNEFCIEVPPLRERKGDIVYLARRFLNLASTELGKEVQLSDDAIEELLLYDWPGNVRELQSCIRRATLLADGVISAEHLPVTELRLFRRNGARDSFPLPKLAQAGARQYSLRAIVRRSVVKAERDALVQVLRQTGGNKAKAARLLQIDYKTIHTKVKQYSIVKENGDSHDQE